MDNKPITPPFPPPPKPRCQIVQEYGFVDCCSFLLQLIQGKEVIDKNGDKVEL